MKHKIHFFILFATFVFITDIVFAQKKTILGFVYNKNESTPIEGVVVSVKGIENAVTLSDSSGHYFFRNIPVDSSLTIKYSHANYATQEIQLEDFKDQIISYVVFMEKEKQTDTNFIKAIEESSVIYIPSDRKLIFYTDALKLNENSTIEDFVSGLPVVTKIDNSYWFEGESVSSFSIDGNTFFTGNDEVILKNIPALFIERAEVYESASTRNGLTGFEDNKYDKAIDLYSNPDFKNSLFGKVYTGISNVERWNIGGNLNFFNGPRVFSIVHETNNINIKNYSGLNLTNMEGSSNLTAFGSRSSSELKSQFSDFFSSYEDFVIDQTNGINENLMFGVTYFDQFDKWKIHGEYFFDKTDNETEASFKRIYFGGSSDSLTYFENSDIKSRNLSHRMNFSATYQFDELQKFKAGSSIFIQGIDANSLLSGHYLSPRNFEIDTLGKANNFNEFSANAYQISFPLTFQKKFRRDDRRNLLVTFTPNYYYEDKTGFLESEYSVIYGPKLPTTNFLLDNQIIYKKGNLNGEVAYSEPITKYLSLLFSWKLNWDINNYQITTDSLRSVSSLNDSLVSLTMKQKEISNLYGLFYKLEWEKLKITQGFYFEQLDLDIEKTFPYHESTPAGLQNYLLPSLFVQYYPNDRNSFRLNYERSVSAPNIQSTRAVLTVNNPLNLEEGNMFLKPSVIDFVSANYLHVNKENTRFFQAYVSASFIQDYIGVRTSQGESDGPAYSTFSGYKIVGFENMNNFYSLNSLVNYNTPLAFISSSFDVFLQNQYNHVPSMYNNEKFFTKENMNQIGLSVKSEINKDIHFIIRSHSSYHHVSTTLNPDPTKYFVQSLIFSFHSLFYNRLLLVTDIDNRFHFGLSNNYENSHYIVWNASLGYRFLRDKSMEFKFSVHDILNQNKNIVYSVTDAYTEVLQTNNLKRYFLFSLTYHLQAKNFRNTN